MLPGMRPFPVPILVAQFVILAALPAAARDRTVACTLEVDGRTYLDGPCTFSPEKDGFFSIGTGDEATASRSSPTSARTRTARRRRSGTRMPA